MGKEFTTAVKESAAKVDGEEYPFEFKLDGEVYRFRSPSGGEGTLLVVAMAKHNDNLTKLSAALDIFSRVLEPEAQSLLNSRLLDPEDPLDGGTIIGSGDDEGILHYMVEEWSGRPTRLSSHSSGSSPDPGPDSTPSTHKSTSSRSRSRSS